MQYIFVGIKIVTIKSRLNVSIAESHRRFMKYKIIDNFGAFVKNN